MTEHGKNSISYLNGSKGIQPVEVLLYNLKRVSV